MMLADGAEWRGSEMVYVGIAVVVVSACVTALFLVRAQSSLSPEQRAARAAQRAAVSAVRTRLHAAETEAKTAFRVRDDAIKRAGRSLESAQREHEKRIAEIESHLRQLRDPKGKRLASYRGVTLNERWITTPHGSGAVAGTHASVDAQISSRITATRLVTIGVFALAAKKKTGHVYLSIDNPSFASVVECPQDDNTRARQFAVKVMNAARRAEKASVDDPRRMKALEDELHAVRTDTSAIDRAKAELARVEADEGLLVPVQRTAEAMQQVRAELEQLRNKAGAAPELPE